MGSIPHAETPVSSGPAPALNILAVDDSSTNRLILTRMLQALGHAVSTASSGEEAVETVKAQRFDLILMDVQMPGIGGIEAARRIREMAGEVGLTPIVAVTADVSDTDRIAYRAVGMDGVVSKPLAPASLQSEMLRVVACAG